MPPIRPLPASRPVRSRAQPRRLTLERVVTEAARFGAAELSMTAVAERLGVSIAALYRHVRDVGELRRLVAEAEIRRIRWPSDRGQPWTALVRGYVERLFNLCIAEPSVLQELMKGSFPPAREIDVLEGFVVALGRRGFSPQDALGIAQDVRIVALGAAVCAISARSIGERYGAHRAVDQAFVDRAANELPLMRSVKIDYRRYGRAPCWRESAERLVTAIAETRGEAPPGKQP